MNNFIKTLTLSVIALILSLNSAFAQNVGPVTGFLLKMDEVKQHTDLGASSIKIFAAKDNNGGLRYVLVGLDAGGEVMSNKIIVNDGTGDCPPTCDFLPKNLNSGILVEGPAASSYVDNYMKAFPETENAVVICGESIEKVVGKYNYMKVTISGKVRVTGVKDDGGIPFLAPFSKECNHSMRCPL